MIFELLLWSSVGALTWVYFGFPAFLWLLAKIKSTPVRKSDVVPSVTLIVCAYNEEKHIREKVENCLQLDYPEDRLEIIVVSDGSTDATNAILRKIETSRVRVHVMPHRSGKTACQNTAAGMARNDVLFFTDATTMHPPEALKILVRSLNDESVGCVTGRPLFERDAGTTSKGLGHRDRYEFYLRAKLGEIHSLLGAQDCMYAIPRRLYRPVRGDQDGGFVGPLLVLERGGRTVYEPDALAFVQRRAPTPADEFIRRSRIVLGGMRGLLHLRRLLNPFKHGFTAVALISSRLLRWLTPVFLIVAFVSNLFLLGKPLYLVLFLLQVMFYVAALAAWGLERMGHPVGFVLYIPLYFCLLAGSAAAGLARLLAGDTGQTWETRR